MTNIRTYTEEQIDAVRSQLRLIMQGEDMSQADIAQKIGVPYGTFTPWMTGKYRGDSSKIAAQAERWINARDAQQVVSGTLPELPNFVRTATAIEIWNVLTFAQAAPDYCIIVGAPGIGKTTTINEYKASNPNVITITAEPTIRSPHTLLAALCEEIGVLERRADRRSSAIANRLRNANALIVIDEAQHCTTAGLEQIRALHDAAQIGIVLAGNESVSRRLHGGGGLGDGASAQLTSRVGMRLVRAKPYERDITDMLDAWGVEGEAERDLLLTIGHKPGALRLVTKVLRVATMIAGGKEAGLSAEHIKSAYKQLDTRG